MFKLISVEIKKIRRSRILWLLLIPLVILWLPSVLNAQNNLSQAPGLGISPQNSFFIQGSLGFTSFIYPASMVVCTVLLVQNERSYHGMLKMLALPISKAALCTAKFIVLAALISLQMLMNLTVYYISAAIAAHITGAQLLLPPLIAIKEMLLVFLFSLPMLSFFWLLAVCIPSPVFAMGAGLASIVPAILIANTKLWFLYPMSYPIYVIASEYGKMSTVFTFYDMKLFPLLPMAVLLLAVCLGISRAAFGRLEA